MERKKKDVEKTFLKVNMEAVEEIARQADEVMQKQKQ